MVDERIKRETEREGETESEKLNLNDRFNWYKTSCYVLNSEKNSGAKYFYRIKKNYATGNGV